MLEWQHQPMLDHLTSLEKFESPHEIYCYTRLYELLSDTVSSRIKEKLTVAVQAFVNNNKAEWDQYVLQPLKFVENPESCKFGISDELLNENLDYLIEQIEVIGQVEPSWEWGSYEEE
mgnify:CR=1 FL=1